MPRTIAPATLTELQRRRIATVKLISLDTTPVTRWCSPWSQGRSVIVDANTYSPRNFTVSDVAAGNVSEAGATFVFDNRDKAISNIVLAGTDLTSLTLTYTVLVKQEWEDDWVEEYIPLVGSVVAASGTLQSWTLAVSVAKDLHVIAGLRTGEVHCQHRYKGIWCQYAGAEVTCDRLYATCQTRLGGDNTIHYGGLRLAPLPGDTILLGYGAQERVMGDPWGGAPPVWRPVDEDAVGRGPNAFPRRTDFGIVWQQGASL